VDPPSAAADGPADPHHHRAPLITSRSPKRERLSILSVAWGKLSS
jgi:hypothetical protein